MITFDDQLHRVQEGGIFFDTNNGPLQQSHFEKATAEGLAPPDLMDDGPLTFFDITQSHSVSTSRGKIGAGSAERGKRVGKAYFCQDLPETASAVSFIVNSGSTSIFLAKPRPRAYR